MIPVRLEITNFLAYCNPAPLDFSGIHVAVLVGENGAGKSSLLDAMTWALWGRARAKTDSELVHQGAAEMRVLAMRCPGSNVRVPRCPGRCEPGRGEQRAYRGRNLLLQLRHAAIHGRDVLAAPRSWPRRT